MDSKSEEFDEKVFIWALTQRSASVKQFAGYFKAEWLRTAPLRKIYDVIVQFTKENGQPPGFKTIKSILTEEWDDEVYNIRFKEIVDEMSKGEDEPSFVTHTLEKAKQVAIVRSFQEVANSNRFLKLFQENDGYSILQELEKWRLPFSNKKEDVHLLLPDAVDKLRDSREFIENIVQAETGIDIVDKWLGGGLRSKNLGIWMAPTGHGKSAVMTFQAHKSALVDGYRTWLISNELDIEQVTERLLARMTGVSLNEIMEDPIRALESKGGQYYHQYQSIGKNLLLSYIDRDASTDDLESEMIRLETIYGWKPQVILIDYMERMKPTVTQGLSKSETWTYYGEIAKDMARLAKRHNICIWTAIQTNRSGLNAKEMTSEMAQGSIRHLQEATAVVSLHQPVEEYEGKQIIEFKPLKMRESRLQQKAIKLECDLSTMTITNIEYYIEEREPGEEDEPIMQKKKSKKPFKPS